MRFKFLRSKVLYLFFLSAIYIIDVIHNKLLVYFPPLQKILIFSSVVFLSSAILFFLCKFFLKEKQKAGIASLLLLFFVFYYFDIYYSLFGISGISKIISGFLFSKFHIVLTGIMTTIFIAAYSFLKRTKKNLSALTSYLNIVFFLFLIFEVYKLIAFPPDKIYRTENKNLQGKADVKRNIYYVVLDSYTSSLSLKKYWHYDNELEIFLKSKGLFIAEKSKCNYNSTPFSLASSLNISYLSLENYKQAQNTQAENIFDLVKNNPVVKSFSENGYEIKNLSFFDLGNSSPYYPDVFYKKENLFDRSIFFLFSEKLHITHEHDQLLNLAKTNLDIFSQLESLPEKQNFYYAHLIIPPYLFSLMKIKRCRWKMTDPTLLMNLNPYTVFFCRPSG